MQVKILGIESLFRDHYLCKFYWRNILVASFLIVNNLSRVESSIIKTYLYRSIFVLMKRFHFLQKHENTFLKKIHS